VALVHVCASYGSGQSLQERLAESGPDAVIVAVVDLLSGLGEPAAVRSLRRLIRLAQGSWAAVRMANFN
jgi:hypothetical protein